MDTRPDHRANRLRVVRENEAVDAKKNREDNRQAVLPGLEDVIKRTVETKAARDAHDEAAVAVRGAVQVAMKTAAVDLVEVRAAHTDFKDANKRLEAARIAALVAPSEENKALLAQRQIEHEHALERLHQRRKTAVPVQGAYGAILKAANIAGNHELGEKINGITVRGTSAFKGHFQADTEAGESE